ncbi:glycosyltransferase family 4 protein [Gelidibacter salicanalis]|uniref:Glycosyltransferase family 4 protein n=1 Tax=Gelidibacter salicanalis TaxID=291193 RepID=A0A934KQ46_9FLAO|nr:glycosyltransferase family 4 protein [Gelidibacter salicanalis]MBJ7881779.1 glycosyltransferase family 4 protein [Gelidibacter salicanalis]
MISKLLIIGHVWPEPRSSAAGSRMMQLIEGFQKEDYEIIFASACTKSDNAFDLSEIGIVQATIEMNHSSFDHFIKSFKPDVVLFDRFMTEEQFGWRVAEQCPNALRVLDTEDLHSLRKGREQAFKDGATFDQSYLFNDFAKREMASIYRCDLSLIISEFEMEVLKSDFKIPDFLMFYLPFQIDHVSEEIMKNLPTFNQRQDFITIGNFLHEPNYNAALYLKETIWPLIKLQLPNAKLHVYGAYASQKVTQLHQDASGFLIKGYAKDVHKVMANAKVCLAPLRFGAGLKGKLVDAMLNGTPCAMSSIAAEGMFGDLKPNGCVEDDPHGFAEQAVQLYQEEMLWKEKQQHGFTVIQERFNKATFHTLFFKTISAIMVQLEEHRHENFTGQMLQHHALQSTKYMSKWIEEKNR